MRSIHNIDTKRKGQDISTLVVLKTYWAVIRLQKIWVYAVLVAMVVSGIIEIWIPLLYKRFFDILTTSTSPGEDVPELISSIILILFIHILGWFLFRSAMFINNYFQARVMMDLKQQAYNYMIQHSYNFFANNFTGSLVQRVNRYSHAFERLADRITFNVIPLFVRITGVVMVLLFINTTVAKIVVGLVGAFLIFNFYFSRWKLKYNIERAAAESKSTGVLADTITNQNTIQMFSGFKRESAYYRNVTDNQAFITKFTWDLDSIVDAVQALIIIVAEFLLFYYAIYFWEEGLVTVGTFVLIQIYLIGLGGRLWDFSRIIRDFYESMADAKEMVEILTLPHEVRDTYDASILTVPEGKIEFKDVSFSFNETRPVLKKLNFIVKGGEKLALVGPSGAGKSTIVKLLLRMYDVHGGRILIDDQKIQHVTQKSLRDSISFVPQDPVLFHRTLMENIRYGRQDATDEEVKQAARLAHCDEFITELPLGYDTYVGERGIKLSGGERQRVAIARAILKNAPILILDEATSSLDSHSEALIQDALENLMRSKTTIVIAHRLSTIRKMDRIVVIENGKIIEEGTHDELTGDKDTLYNKLWTLQAGGFLLDAEE